MFELTDEPDAAEQWNAYVLRLEHAAAKAIAAFLCGCQTERNWEWAWEKGEYRHPISSAFNSLLRLLNYTDSRGFSCATSYDGMGTSWIRVTDSNRLEIAGLIYLVDGPLAPFAAWFQVADDGSTLVDYEIRFWDDCVVKMTWSRAEDSLYLGAPGVPPASWNLKFRIRKRDVVAENLFPPTPRLELQDR